MLSFQSLKSLFKTIIKSSFLFTDEYFLSNVKTIDDITDKKKETLLLSTNWKQNVINALSTWPCVNILKDLPVIDFKGKLCAGCNEIKIYARVLLYGQPYNSTTLEGSPPDPKVPQEKVFKAIGNELIKAFFNVFNLNALGLSILSVVSEKCYFIQ